MLLGVIGEKKLMADYVDGRLRIEVIRKYTRIM